MTKTVTLEPKLERMLTLLSEGASTRVLARKMGYSEGTVRVYLHNLYRKLGVRNRTEAVLWRLKQEGARRRAAAAPAARADETFGEAALREGLLAALGIMESFIGPYGRVWEVGLRLKGGTADEESNARRAGARALWRGLLDGDFTAAKRAYDEGGADRLAQNAPSEAVLLGISLALGGYSGATETVTRLVGRARKPAAAASVREIELLRAVRGAATGDADALTAVYRVASSSAGSAATLRHVAMAALFHLYRAARDGERAAATADAVWAEAEGARRQLEAMGVKSLPRDPGVPAPAKAGARSVQPAREKATLGR